MAENILSGQGEVYYYPKVFDNKTSEEYFKVLLSEIRWKQEPVKLFGREIMQPRLTAWYGDEDKSYTYSGITMQAYPWIKPLIEIKEQADRIAGSKSTSALLNLYRDGNDGMGWHRDNEKMLGRTPVIVSVSFGAARIFQLRNYHTKKELVSLELEPGSILVMKGESQQHWEHRIPKRANIPGARINLTFREIR